MTNFRDDKITSAFWRDSFQQRRCLVPASSFCEPKGERPWHWFALNGSEPRPVFAFAGIWRRWKGPLRKNGENVDVYAFMTMLPNELVATVNDRVVDLNRNRDEREAQMPFPEGTASSAHDTPSR